MIEREIKEESIPHEIIKALHIHYSSLMENGDE